MTGTEIEPAVRDLVQFGMLALAIGGLAALLGLGYALVSLRGWR